MENFLKEWGGNSPLRQEIIQAMCDSLDDLTYDEVVHYLNEVVEYGCTGGTVSGMIYTYDIEEFFKNHFNEINEFIQESLESSGVTIDNLVRNFDTLDPFCTDSHNRTMVTWFVYESLCADLMCYVESEYDEE